MPHDMGVLQDPLPDKRIIPHLAQLATMIGETSHFCVKCGIFYITSATHKDGELCTKCACVGTFTDSDFYRERNRGYQRKHRARNGR